MDSSAILANGHEEYDQSVPTINMDSAVQEALLATNLITEKMINEEKAVTEKVIKEEQKLRETKESLRNEQQEQSFKRLHLLLSRSSLFANVMSEKLKKEESKIARKRKRTEEGNHLKDITQDKLVENSSTRKKLKPEVGMLDVYKDEALRNKILDDINSQNADANPKSLIEAPKLLSGGTLRPYQLEGYDWIKTLFENGVNGILADEMGLGKTIQCIAVITYLIEQGVTGPFFVCGPLSTVPNWFAEIQRFAPDVPVLLYHGDKKEREVLRKQINKQTKVGKIYVKPIVVTSYSMALIDVALLKRFDWKMLVVDEAHRIKNFQCKLIRALRSYSFVSRLLLTGTPLQNNLAELWSLLNFIIPEVFDDLQVFEAWFDISDLTERGATKEIVAREQEKQIVTMMHQILTPFLLRRTKADVELSLPPKKEMIIHATLTPLQKLYYSGVLNHNILELLGVEKKTVDDDVAEKRIGVPTKYFGTESDMIRYTSRPSTSKKKNSFIDPNVYEINCKTGSMFMLLRKICCHPYLLTYPIDTKNQGFLVDENIVKQSGKLQLLDIMLPELQKRGHKVLLFSQFVIMLEILEDYCHFRGYKYTRLYGSMSLEERQSEMKDFAEDDSISVFLISTRAGGLGLNLISADTVILYDSDWNPQGDLQAQDRCHRIGQTKPVVVYRFVVPHTVDERMINRATAKRKLEKAIINNGRFKSKHEPAEEKVLSRDQLLELLESPDFDEIVKAECIISREELDRILDRSDMVTES